jgi:hypothetical protein
MHTTCFDKHWSSSGNQKRLKVTDVGSVEKKSGRGAQGAWRQDKLIGDKPPVPK